MNPGRHGAAWLGWGRPPAENAIPAPGRPGEPNLNPADSRRRPSRFGGFEPEPGRITFILRLNDEQIRRLSLEEKDQWWYDHVFQGDAPQLTVRSALTGMGLGIILSLTNLYIGIMTGWTLGVGVTSVILAFSLFKVLSRIGLGSEIGMLENNAMQSIATSAGYMTAPLVSSVSAYMLVTGRVIPLHQTMLWIIALAILGVLVAFPLKRRFINDEHLPFPEGRAAGIVMDELHNRDDGQGLFKSKLLAASAGISALIEVVSDEASMSCLGLKYLALPDYLDSYLY